MKYFENEFDKEKRGIDDPALNQDVSFSKKDDEDFDDTDDFHKYDDTDDETKNVSDGEGRDSRVLDKSTSDHQSDSVKRAGQNDGNIYI